MTNVSKNLLSEKARDKLFLQFTSLFTDSKQKNISNLFESLFTDSEKIMFIKRLAIILMIAEGYSNYAISKALKVSEATARALKSNFFLGTYDALIQTTQQRDFDSRKFWESVDLLLRLGMPSYGKDRWKSLNKNLNR